jgi:hypothetical protein
MTPAERRIVERVLLEHLIEHSTDTRERRAWLTEAHHRGFRWRPAARPDDIPGLDDPARRAGVEG